MRKQIVVAAIWILRETIPYG